MLYWDEKMKIRKWFLFTFAYKCVSETVLTKVAEISIIDFRPLSGLQVVVHLPIFLRQKGMLSFGESSFILTS